MVELEVDFPAALEQQLVAIAAARGVDVNDVVIEALARFLEAEMPSAGAQGGNRS